MTNGSLRLPLGSTVIVFAAGCGRDSVVTPDADAPQPSAARGQQRANARDGVEPAS